MDGDPVRKAEPLVVDVPVAGAMAGLSRVRSYAAVKDGSMPTIKVAGRLKVPLKAWKKILDGEAAA
jgi:hypothetical protein